MAMKLIYQNATNDEVPLRRTFVFDKETVVRFKGVQATVPKTVTLDVPKGGKVFAPNEPSDIIYHEPINRKLRK